jgi:DNA-binding transcriptional ArsR family regulator
VSQHLALLRKDGLAATRRDGQTIYYSIASESARAVIETLYRLYCEPIRRTTTAAEQPCPAL